MAKKTTTKKVSTGSVPEVKAVYDPSKFLDSSIKITDGLFLQKSQQQPFNFKQAYTYYNSWIYAASKANATACSNTTIRLYSKSNKKDLKYYNTRTISKKNLSYLNGLKDYSPSLSVKRKVSNYAEEYVEVLDHPILDLLYNVNNYENSYSLAYKKWIDLQITGSAYWHIVFNQQLGIPEELYFVPSIHTYPIPSKNMQQLIDGYAFGTDTQKLKRFETDEIIQFKLPSTTDLYYGDSMLASVFNCAALNLSNMQYRRALSDNLGRPDYAIIFKDAQSTHQGANRYEKQLEQIYSNNDVKRKFVSLPANVELKELNFMPKDMALQEVEEQIIRQVSSCFGIPETLLKMGDSNYSNSMQGNRTFLKNIQSLLIMDEEQLNQNLLPLFNVDTDHVFLAYDNIVPEDSIEQNKKLTLAISSNAYSIGKIQELQGEVVDADLNNIYIIAGQPYTKEQLLRGKPDAPNPFLNFNKEDNKEEDKEEDNKKLLEHIDNKFLELNKKEQQQKDTEEDKELQNNITLNINNYSKKDGTIDTHIEEVIEEDTHIPTPLELFMAKYDNLEEDTEECKSLDISDAKYNPMRNIYNIVNDLFLNQRRLIAEYIEEGQKSIREDLIDIIEGFAPSFIDSLSPHIKNIIVMGGTHELNSLNISLDVWNVINPQVQKYAKEQSSTLIKGINKTTLDKVRTTISEGMKEGFSPQMLAKAIREDTAFNRVRSEMIARTESGRSYNAGQIIAAEESGVVDHYKLMISRNACPICVDLKDKQFSASEVLDEPVLHVNCRCSWGSIIRA